MNQLLRLFVILFPIVVFFGCSTTSWIKDPSTGCEVFNPNPKPGEYIKYEGNCLNGKADGYGTLTWFQDSCAINRVSGRFVSGKLEGRVSIQYFESTASRFEGYFVSGTREGFGTYTFLCGKTVSGIFHKNELTDSVVIEWKNGKRYRGQMKGEDHMLGQGSLLFPNGDTYVGPFRNNKRHGKGVYKWSNGDTYEGEYDDDSSAGPGFYTFANGSKFAIDAIPSSMAIQKEQPSLQRTGLLNENTAKEFSSRLGKRLPYPESLRKVGAEMDAKVRVQIGSDGLIKKYRFSIERIVVTKQSKYSPSGYEPDPSERVISIQEEEAVNIIKAIQELSFQPASEEGVTFDLWISIPLHFRLRDY